MGLRGGGLLTNFNIFIIGELQGNPEDMFSIIFYKEESKTGTQYFEADSEEVSFKKYSFDPFADYILSESILN